MCQVDRTMKSLESTVDSFFLRSGLTAQDKMECYELVQLLYPSKTISLASYQGYCSMTLYIGEDRVIQFRPVIYRLDLQITAAARSTHSTLVPNTRYITTTPSGLLMYEMERIDGLSLAELQVSESWKIEHKTRLCSDLAAFLSQSWYHGRVDTLALGLVGKSLVSRLEKLLSNLPQRFQGRTQQVLGQMHQIEALPWVLTHGDLRASNIMVDATTGRLLGIIDWTEAELLPFGICLYGLEEILGVATSSGFSYSPDASFLRNVFWTEMFRTIPTLEQNSLLEVVQLARDLGVLLWFGISFDDGAISRVVSEDKDVEEIHKLDAFLRKDTSLPLPTL